MKWQFVDKKSPKPKYICCNADESEPGIHSGMVDGHEVPGLELRDTWGTR